MGYNTKIDWCDASWNPITGCQHDCEYCYARGIASRFGGFDHDEERRPVGGQIAIGIQELEKPKYIMRKNGLHKAPYPWFFLPTLHKYRMDQPSKWSNGRNIFVGSMTDIWGEWVPDSWIMEVIDACTNAPQHRYMFLTKNPIRYIELEDAHPLMLPSRENFWYGTTVVNSARDAEAIICVAALHKYNGSNTFISIEPLLGPLTVKQRMKIAETQWVIIGAETGNRKEKVVPKKWWVDDIMYQCRLKGVPVFMKESLRELMGADFVQEFPWEAKRCGE